MELYVDLRIETNRGEFILRKEAMKPDMLAKLEEIAAETAVVTVYYGEKESKTSLQWNGSVLQFGAAFSESVRKELEVKRSDTLRFWIRPQKDEDGEHVLAVVKISVESSLQSTLSHLYADVGIEGGHDKFRLMKNAMSLEARSKLEEICAETAFVMVYYGEQHRKSLFVPKGEYFEFGASFSKNVKRNLNVQKNEKLRFWIPAEKDKDGDFVFLVVKV